MRGVLVGVLTAVCMAAATGTAWAAGDPDAVEGLIADRCTGCHKVPGYEARWQKADLGAPPFQAIADDPETYPPAGLRDFLQKPHWPMTEFILSPRDIDNVLAFIARLRGD